MHQNSEFWRRRKMHIHRLGWSFIWIRYEPYWIWYDIIWIWSFFFSIFQIHNLSLLFVVVLINGVKKQVPQVSYKNAVGDLIWFHSFGSVMNLFRSDLISDLILFGSNFKIQELSVMVVAALTNSGVKNQVPNFSSKLLLGIWC